MTHGPTVLLVDDEAVDLETIGGILRQQDYRVLEAGSYSAAIKVFDANRDDLQLLITDVSLPDGNGCALAIAMRKQKPDLRVLFISFHVGAEICRYYGMDVPDFHFLKKPFDERLLLSRVNMVLAGEPSTLPFRNAAGSSGGPE